MRFLQINVFVFLMASFSFAQQQMADYEANAYIGKYEIETQSIKATGLIRYENGGLIFFTEGIPEVKLWPEMEVDKFRADKFEVTLLFIRNEFKDVIAAKIWFQEQEFLAKKNMF